MYIYDDFERLLIHYKTEIILVGVSIESSVNQTNFSYNLFERWYKDMCKKSLSF